MFLNKFYILSWILILATLSYFSYHIYHGNRGLIAQSELSKKYKRLSVFHDSLKKEREKLEYKIDGLSDNDGKIDKDFLEEEARKLGYAYADEIVIRE